jgi:hypothetical protein
MINHSVHFVDPYDRRIRTQKKESMWRAAKQKFKAMNGVDRKYLKSYLIENTWRYSHCDNRMEVFKYLIQLIPKHHDKIIKYDDVDEIWEVTDENDDEEGYLDFEDEEVLPGEICEEQARESEEEQARESVEEQARESEEEQARESEEELERDSEEVLERE